MAMVINTNMPAVNANRILDQTSREQTTAMERLTSGLRINKAADDAAGLSVTTGMTSQIMGTDQAIRNADSGISLVQTVDGASDEVVSMLQRMRELSVQSMNGTFNDTNRDQMNTEYTELTNEIDRVAKTTKFNEINLMINTDNNGQVLSTQPADINTHVGWQTGEDNKIAISVANFQVSTNALMASTGQPGVGNNFGSVNQEITVGSAGTLLYGKSQVSVHPTSTGVYNAYMTLAETNIETETDASAAVGVIDGSLSNISDYRAKWGALQNRMESTISNLGNVNQNMEAARSQIQDADFAQESANLAKTQVLQQAGMSMLSQANQQSQNVLSLLR